MDDKLLSNLSLSNSTRPQEKVESIEQIIYSLNKYIREPESLNEVFTTDLTKAVSLILQHPIITGQRGDELASDLIFRVIKLFFNICEKNYENRSEISKDFFSLIRNIFDEYYHHNFFVTKEQDKDLVKGKGTHKDLNYTDYNKFFQNDFEIKENPVDFQKYNLVDIYIKKYNPKALYQKKEWVRGIISTIDYDKREYNIKYFGQVENAKHVDKEDFKFHSPFVVTGGSKTEYLEKKSNFREKDEVDICIEKEGEKEKINIWYPGKIIDIDKNKMEDKEDLMNLIYTVEYDDIFLNDKNNKENENDIFYEKNDSCYISYDSFRIQKNHIFSDIQKKINKMKNENKNLANHYEDLLNFIFDIFENDQNIEDFYNYKINEGKGEEQKTNYIIGKWAKKYSFYFSKLLKAMADNNYFEIIKDTLKNNPEMEKTKTIFCILVNCLPFLHRGYLKENYEIFEDFLFDLIDTKSIENVLTKNDIENFIFILAKMKFLIYYKEEDFNIKKEINKLFINLGLKMIESDKDTLKKIGLELIFEIVDYSTEEEKEDKTIIELLLGINNNSNRNYGNILYLIFDDTKFNLEYSKSNYKTKFIEFISDFIEKSSNIFNRLIKYGYMSEEYLRLIWEFITSVDNNLILQNKIIELFLKFKDNFDRSFCNNMMVILNDDKIKIPKNDSLYILNNEIAQKGNNSNSKNEQLKCCDYFTKRLLEEKDFHNLDDPNNETLNYFLKEVTNYFSREAKFYNQISGNFKKNFRNKENIIITLYTLQKILLKQKNIDDYKELELIDAQLFKKNFSEYKRKESEKLEELKKGKKELYLKELDNHNNNMKIFIDYLFEIIRFIFPNQDHFNLFKEISFDNPVVDSDKQLFYDYIENLIDNEKDKDTKEKIEIKILDIIKEEKKDNLTLKLIKIFIRIFCDINITRENLIKDEEKLIKGTTLEMEDIYEIDGLWDVYFKMKSKELSEELKLFISKLYQDNKGEENLMKKCLKEI